MRFCKYSLFKQGKPLKMSVFYSLYDIHGPTYFSKRNDKRSESSDDRGQILIYYRPTIVVDMVESRLKRLCRLAYGNSIFQLFLIWSYCNPEQFLNCEIFLIFVCQKIDSQSLRRLLVTIASYQRRQRQYATHQLGFSGDILINKYILTFTCHLPMNVQSCLICKCYCCGADIKIKYCNLANKGVTSKHNYTHKPHHSLYMYVHIIQVYL